MIPAMKQFMATIQGKKIQPDIQYINKLITDNPSWGRSRLSLELCRQWNWHNHNGQYKDMACRNLLLKLERVGCIVLPERQRKYMGRSLKRSSEFVPHLTEEINGNLRTFGPLQIASVAQYSDDNDLFNCLVSKYHYLGYGNAAGENIKYLVRDHTGRPLACLLFCSAAWKVQSRDSFIGWDHERREVNLCYVANNSRFLILPWIKIPHLASHILSRISKRLSSDWSEKYGHPVYLLETFVDRTLFRGVCYRAANWVLAGQTKGRTRNDRDHTIKTSIKDVYVYPLVRTFRKRLCGDDHVFHRESFQGGMIYAPLTL